MAKKIIGNLKLRIPAGRATAGPPVGSTLGQWGLNMMDFINPFNDATKDLMGKDVIVHIQVYEDRTFTWKSLGQPVDDMIRAAIGIQKGSGKPHTDKVGKITRAQLEEIAKAKMDHVVHWLPEALPGKGAVFVHLNVHDNVLAHVGFSSVVEWIDEIHHIKTPLTERRTNRRTCGRTTSWNSQLEVSNNFLSHS
jgi:large subunit ribosomal protein L11